MSLILDDVGHEYETGRALFSAISVELIPGRTYAVVGPSGAGKSTLLNILSGNLEPTRGRVVRARSTTSNWVFQNPHGVPGRRALDHVALAFLARGDSRAEAEGKARDLLDQFALGSVAEERFRHLSGGEAQRLMLARAIAAAPGVLLVDEPTAQLDVRTAAVVNESLGRLAERGCIVVIATHDAGTRDSCTDVLDLAGYQS
ncbi:ATP-binding cassette domain-containing protein [Microbacterium sp. KSW4-17]|uniref:ATP-binding cassette domain-containing protein n=1 Tax=Microbacterium galbum TaxID=3075994 RepID=A0ABU3T8H6_9MICO|nr:ATP-binding cassette domain-containing protein [Microbacterium sp. KSW4-17]MDU0367632.1 ATP-binding cassette domain-containing protein [Microbacterium sp. KSW4-17]